MPPGSPLPPVGHKEWPTESGDCPTESGDPPPGIPSPPAQRGEMPKAEGGWVLTSWERKPPSVTHLPPLRGGRGDLFSPRSAIEAFSFLTNVGKVTPLLPHTAPAQIARLHEIHHRAIATALREYRLTLRELRPAAKARALADAEAEAFDFAEDQLVDAPRPEDLPDPAETQPTLNEPDHLRPVGPPTFEPAQTPEQRERATLSIIGDYERSKTRSTNPDQPQPARPDRQPLEPATAKTPPDTPTTEPPESPETDAELEARMHAQLDILEQAALRRFPELAQTD